MTRIPTPFGKAIEISTQVFIDKLLPPLHADIDADIFLHEAGVSRKSKLLVTKNGRLWGYSLKQPSELKGQRAVFKSLQTCTEKLTKIMAGLDPTLEFRNNHQGEWALNKRTVDSLPDAYLLLVQRPNCIDWTTIAIPGAYIQTKTERNSKEVLDTAYFARAQLNVIMTQNVTKITRCMSQCMHHDARRRFVYGFTIEDSTMRLWYCDRAHIFVSEIFDFVTEWRILFRFFLSSMFAAHHELGFDPSVELLDSETTAEARYELKVRSIAGEEHIYRTLGVLANTDAGLILGRGTRVWKAVRIEDGKEVGDPVALKDSWVEDHREREGSIDWSIRESATSDDRKAALDKSLLTVMTHGDVFVDGASDRTKLTALLVHDARENATPIDDDRSRTSPDRQVHYRIVYKEVCEPLHSVTSLFKILKALGDACHGLSALYECGWVHRDVSAGNILLFNDFAKISDLEYAERTDQVDGHQDGLVGTAYFRAAEVQSSFYLFIPETGKNPLDKYPPGFDFKKLMKENRARITRGEPPLLAPESNSPDPAHDKLCIPSFRYNPLHDLESLWWIAVYFLISREVIDPDQDQIDDSVLQRCHAQRRVARELFRDGKNRKLVIMDAIYFARQLPCLHPSLQIIAESIELARKHLVVGYMKAEKNLQNTVFKLEHDVHGQFIHAFYTSAVELSDQDILLRSLDPSTFI